MSSTVLDRLGRMKTSSIIAVVALVLVGRGTNAAVINVPSEQLTIQAGIDAATDGDTVLVGPGAYYEHLNYLGKTITVTSSAGADSTFLLPVEPDTTMVRLISGESLGTEFSGFTISGSMAGYVILIDNNSYATISRNRFIDIPTTGKIVRCNSMSATVDRNIFANCPNGTAVVQWGLTGKVNVINNIFDNIGNGGYGFGGLVYNNIFTNCTGGAVSGYDKVDYNVLWNSDIGEGNEIVGTNNIVADPLFVDPLSYNYNLQWGSPAIDAGNPDSVYYDPDGSTNDAGIFPFLSSNYPVATRIELVPELYDNWVSSVIPEISWYYLDTSVSSQAQYHLQVGNDQDWTAAELWDTGPISSTDSSLIYSGAPLFNYSKYYLRIRVNNGTDWGDWRERAFWVRTGSSVWVPQDQVSVEAALEWCDSGDTIFLDSGYYSGLGFIDIFLEEQKTISIVAPHGPERTIIDLQGGNFMGFDWSSNLVMRGVQILGGGTVFNAVGASYNISLVDCIFRQNSYVLMVGGMVSYAVIDSCRFLGNTTGIVSLDGNSYLTVTRSLFRDNYIAINCESYGSSFSKNIFVRNFYTMILETGNYDIEDNVFYDNTIVIQCLWCNYGGSVDISCNDFFGNTAPFLNMDSQIGLNGNFSAEPQFCDTSFATTEVAYTSPLLAANNSCGLNIGDVTAGCYCGDPNMTGTLDVSDLTFLVAYLFNEGPAPNPLSAGDVDGSGEIDIVDVTYLVAYLFQGGAAPVCSWPPQL